MPHKFYNHKSHKKMTIGFLNVNLEFLNKIQNFRACDTFFHISPQILVYVCFFFSFWQDCSLIWKIRPKFDTLGQFVGRKCRVAMEKDPHNDKSKNVMVFPKLLH